MDESSLCTRYRGSNARICTICRPTSYCSGECQETDFRTRNTLDSDFKNLTSNVSTRPSPNHHLGLYFSMTTPRPRLEWIEQKECVDDENIFHAELDSLLHIPGHKHVGRHLLRIAGNSLHRRKTNKDTLNIWHLDDPIVKDLSFNESLNGTVLAMIGDAWGRFRWQGPVVVVMRVGNAWNSRFHKDITLTGYRDAIDFLVCYLDRYRSMIDEVRSDRYRSMTDGVRSETDLAKRPMADTSEKIWGVRMNFPVAVNKTDHDYLFGPGDHDFLAIPELMELTWVATQYGGGEPHRDNDDVHGDLKNPLARLLLLELSVEDGKWEGLYPRSQDPNIGSILVVNRRGLDLTVGQVRTMCKFIEQEVSPLMTDERALTPGGVEKLSDAITEDVFFGNS